jgi:hypothetical protein
MTKHQSRTTGALKPCPFCGSDCRTEIFDGPHIEGEVTLWICSNHKRFGGDCESDLAYLTAEAWNTRPSPIAEPQDADALKRTVHLARAYARGTGSIFENAMTEADRLADRAALNTTAREGEVG